MNAGHIKEQIGGENPSVYNYVKLLQDLESSNRSSMNAEEYSTIINNDCNTAE